MTNLISNYYDALLENKQDFELRPIQLKISDLIEKSFRQNSIAVIEAGTGSGKSIAALLPVIATTNKKTVISTYTISLQEQYINKDLPFLSKVFPDRFTYCQLKGRNNYLSLRRYLDFSQSNQVDTRISDWLYETNTGDKSEFYFTPDYSIWSQINSDSNDCLGSICPKFNSCFYFNARKTADNSDIIVVNHTLLLLDAMANGSILPAYDYLIVDEAHHLPQAAYDVFSLNFSYLGIKQLGGKISKQLNHLSKVLNDVENKTNDFFLVLSQNISQNKLRIKQTPEFTLDLIKLFTSLKQEVLLIDLNKLTIDEMAVEKLKLKAKAIIAQIDSYLEILNLLVTLPSEYVIFIQPSSSISFNPKITAIPLDVSEFIFDKLISKPQLQSSIYMSATLNTGENEPFQYFSANSGLNRTNFNSLIAHSDFNYKDQALLYLPKNIPDPNNESFINVAGSEIIKLLNLTYGKAFILFTSYSNMNKAFDLIYPQINFPCKKQNDMPANKLVEWFTNTDNSVLFATAGFWEGISIDGDSLSLVIIDRIPFKTPGDPHYEAKCDKIKSQNNASWFNELALPYAIIKLKQGVGRLIRTKNDTGIVAILDNRLTSKSYGRRIIKCLPDMKIMNDFSELNHVYNKTMLKK